MIRPLVEDDLDRVIEIELSAYPFPWTQGIFADCIRVGHDCSALQAGHALIGYVVQTHAAGESHLLNLCISPQWQSNGYGSLLLDHAIRRARRHYCSNMFLEVRPSNPAGIGLYQRKGFGVVARRPAYYRAGEGQREDAIIMRLDL